MGTKIQDFKGFFDSRPQLEVLAFLPTLVDENGGLKFEKLDL